MVNATIITALPQQSPFTANTLVDEITLSLMQISYIYWNDEVTFFQDGIK